MSDISIHNIDWFSALSADQIADWFDAALRRYQATETGLAAFSPLDGGLARSDTIAAAIVAALELLEPEVLVRFKRALTTIVGSWPADAGRSWVLMIELMWRLGATEAIAALAIRSSRSFLDVVVGDDDRAFRFILSFCRQTLPFGDVNGSAFLRRLAEHPRFPDSEARLTLMALCERDPARWTSHIAALREQLHAQMARVEATKGEEAKAILQTELVRHIGDCVSLEDLVDGLTKLHLVGDGPHGATDNWFAQYLPNVFALDFSSHRAFIGTMDRPSNKIALKDAPVWSPSYRSMDLADPDVALGLRRVPELEPA